MLHIISSIAHPMATPFGAYLLRTGGYICVFSTEMLCLTIGSIILVWRLQKYKWNPPKTMVILGPTQVKCRLLSSSIFDAMNCIKNARN